MTREVPDPKFRSLMNSQMKRRRWRGVKVTGPCRAMANVYNCKRRATQAHHIIRRSQGGGNEPENLLPVCDWCHQWIHANPREAHELGLLKRRGDAPTAV